MIREVKNAFNELIIKLDTTGEKNFEFPYVLIEPSQTEKPRNKKTGKVEQNIEEL